MNAEERVFEDTGLELAGTGFLTGVGFAFLLAPEIILLLLFVRAIHAYYGWLRRAK